MLDEATGPEGVGGGVPEDEEKAGDAVGTVTSLLETCFNSLKDVWADR